MNQGDSEIELEIQNGTRPPLHTDMLFLIGYYQDRIIGTLDITDATMIKNMKYGRKSLMDYTKIDFGYDVLAWQEYLLANHNFFYLPPFRSDPNFPEFVRKHASFPRRDRLVALIQDRDE